MNNRVLFVDDNLYVLNSYKRSFRNLFNIETAHSGRSALAKLETDGPFAVIISDMRMPEMSGYEFLMEAVKIAPDTTQIVLTGYADINDAIKTINQTQVYKYLIKPCENELLTSVIKKAIKQHQLVISEKELLEKTLKGTVKLLVEILSMTNPEAFSQASRIKKISKEIADKIKFNDYWQLELSALLSQLGRIMIPHEILEKKYNGEALSSAEQTIYDSHPKFAKELLLNIPRLQDVSEYVYFQGLNYDGSEGSLKSNLNGKEIPIISRILKVVIDFDDLNISGLSKKQAVQQLKAQKSCYDPELLKILDAIVVSLENLPVIKEIHAKELQEGMILADHIYSVNHAILISKDHEITDILKIRIRQLALLGKIVEPIKVRMMTQ